MKPRIPKNLLLSIEARRYGPYSRSMKSIYRYGNRLVRNLVESPDWLFKRVMKVKSQKSIAFDCPGKLYVGNSRECYTLRGSKGKPSLLYSIDPESRPGGWRCEAYLTITRAGMANPNPPRCDLRLLLVSKSFLEIREESNGALMETLDLNSPDSPGVQFKTLSWDPNLDQVIATSTIPDGNNVLRYILVLEICPVVRRSLRFPIERKIFGNDIIDVALCDGILKVTHKKETVRLYDFNEICRNNKIVEGAQDQILQIKNLGQPLYVVRGTTDLLDFGGFPFHYVAHSQRKLERSVCAMDHTKLVTFSMEETDTLNFHPDDSGIVTRFEDGNVTFFKIKSGDDTGPTSVEELRTLKLEDPNPPVEQEEPPAPNSDVPGRRPRRRAARRPPLSSAEDEEQTLLSDDFENELNLNLLMGMEKHGKRALIQFFDNETGRLVKTMRFTKRLSHFMEFLVTLDLDVLTVISAQQGGTSSEAHVYRLLHRDAWLDENPDELYDPPGKLRRRFDPDVDFAPP